MCNQQRSGARAMRWGIVALVFCLGSLSSPLLRAQSGDSDSGEVAAFTGGSFDPGTHPVVGASAGLAFSRYGIGLMEVAFSPLGNDTLRHRTGVPVEGSRLYDFNFSF